MGPNANTESVKRWDVTRRAFGARDDGGRIFDTFWVTPLASCRLR